MRHSNRSAAILIIAASCLASSSCHSTHASPASSRPAPQAASSAKPSDAPSSVPALSQPSKHPPRDSEFTVYHNPDYGIAFRYPRNYALEEGPQSDADSDDPAFLQAQQELAAEQPGATLIATVAIPDDAYPNTSFQSGSLQFVINPQVTPDACRAFALSADSGLSPTSGSIAIHGIPFDWRLSSSDDAGAYVENVVYAGYSSETCYEFRIEITASNYVDPDSAVKPADIPKILRALEKIVSSFQVHSKPATAPAA